MLELCEPHVTPKPSDAMGAIWAAIDRNREDGDKDHDRLRKTLDSVEVRLTAALDRIQKLENAPVTPERVQLSGKPLWTLIVAAFLLGGGIMNLQFGLSTISRDIAASTKLQDDRNLTQKEAMDQLRTNLEMRRVEIQRLSDKLTDYMQQHQPK